MKSIDLKIARSEAEWQKNRYVNAGVRECAGRLFLALERSLLKRIYCLVRNICPAVKRERFRSSYDKDRENIVVSLTSTKDRIGTVFPTLVSLAAQTRKPDLIVLWLGENEVYPESVISKIKQMGVLIRYGEDLGPNTKYYHAFREYSNDVVITVDDDIIYHREMIEELYAAYLKYPDAVTARRVHRIRFGRNRKPLRYVDWIWECRDCAGPAHDLMATGTGGVLYPPVVMALKCWESKDFLKVCPKADDIWLKFSELNNGIRVCAVCGARFHRDSVNLKASKTTLAAVNVRKGRNDLYIKACAGYFGMEDDLCERILGANYRLR